MSDERQPEVDFCILGQWFCPNSKANLLFMS